MNNEQKKQTMVKILNYCLDTNNKKVDINIILESNIFSKSEYDDLKVFYGNSQAIKKIEEKEFAIEETLDVILNVIDKSSKRLLEIENLLYPTEEEEKEYCKLLTKLSKYNEKQLKLKRKQKPLISKQDLLFEEEERKFKEQNRG